MNSFGYGGINAHVVLERYNTTNGEGYIGGSNDERTPSYGPSSDHLASVPYVFILSARCKRSLWIMIEALQRWLHTMEDGHYLRDLSFTLLRRRSLLEWRTNFVAASHSEMLTASPWTEARSNIHKYRPSGGIGLLFSGQGAQRPGMGRQLMECNSAFRDSILKSESVLQGLGGSWTLSEDMCCDASNSRIDQSSISQPEMTALQIALVDLLDSLGVRPSSVIGYSSGEIVAGYACGAISQATALKLAYLRGQLTGASGAMLAVNLGEDDTLSRINSLKGREAISIACVNSAVNTTVSGSESAILALKENFDRSSITNRKLNVRTAYHSQRIRERANDYLAALGQVHSKPPKQNVAFISSVTASEKSTSFGSDYWVENLRSKVRYQETLQAYCRRNVDATEGSQTSHLLIEIGPHSSLAGFTKLVLNAVGNLGAYEYTSIMKREKCEVRQMLEVVSTLIRHGLPVDLRNLVFFVPTLANADVIRNLPPYQWDHSQEYWHESRLSRNYRLRPHPYNELCGIRVVDGSPAVPTWRHIISLDRFPWLADHVVDDLVTFPGAGYLCMTIEAIRQLDNCDTSDTSQRLDKSYSMREIAFQRALVVPAAPQQIELYLSLHPSDQSQDSHGFTIAAVMNDNSWREYCSGKIAVIAPLRLRDSEDNLMKSCDLSEEQGGPMGKLRVCQSQLLGSQQLYAQLKTDGNYYGQQFANVRHIAWCHQSQTIAEVRIPETISSGSPEATERHIIHPTILDALLQCSLLLRKQWKDGGSVVPTEIEEITVSSNVANSPGQNLIATSFLEKAEHKLPRTKLLAFNHDGPFCSEPIVAISGLVFRGLGKKGGIARRRNVRPLLSYQMVWGPDVEFLDQSSIICLRDVKDVANQARILSILKTAASELIAHCVKDNEMVESETLEWHHYELLSWMRRSTNVSSYTESAFQSETFTETMASLRSLETVEGEMLARVGGELSAIVQGRVDALSLMLRDDLLYRYYTADSSSHYYAPMCRYIEHLHFKNPKTAILEIGAGNAGATRQILKTLSKDGEVRVDRFDFTDVSTGFFNHARRTLREWDRLLDFRTLDIERDPISQGLEADAYDLIIAANVLHATENVKHTLRNVRKLLKPGGRLLLIEATAAQPFMNVIFGTLRGWWKGETVPF